MLSHHFSSFSAFQVSQGSVETLFRWGGKRLHHFAGNLFRKRCTKLCQNRRFIEDTVKPVFFACPLFREFCEPDKFVKITGRENLNTVGFQCSRKQNAKITGSKIMKLTQTPKLRVAKIKGFTVLQKHTFVSFSGHTVDHFYSLSSFLLHPVLLCNSCAVVIVQQRSMMHFLHQTRWSSRFLASLVQALIKLESSQQCWHTVSLWWARLMKWKQQ